MKYTIKQGDTLSQIARTYNTTVNKLLAANPHIVDRNKIYAGHDLIIPGVSDVSTTGTNLIGRLVTWLTGKR
jgi:LysM repeat protein